MPALQVRLSTFGVAEEQSAIKNAIAEPRNDLTERFAEHCAQTTTKLLGASPLYFDQPAFCTPQIPLDEFIERLLRSTNAPLSASVASLAIINWIAEAGACPLASSSPHHLFMAVHQAVLHPAWDFRDVDEDWSEYAGGCVPLAEVTAMRKEVEPFIENLGRRRWAVLSDLISEDINDCVAELYHAECLQAQDEAHEAEKLEIMQEQLLDSGFLVYECESDSDDSDDDTDDFDFDEPHFVEAQESCDARISTRGQECIPLLSNDQQHSKTRSVFSLEVLQ
ncbi:hypothetical protein EYR40_003014 [Pleurotus pulmonarius]|nr:hypothetical protein EYR36_005462 [Pleurotus pulmonarius]KAF4580616.1 hypothetical protein EYR40_003014 [Pleurotus pulmonarius]